MSNQQSRIDKVQKSLYSRDDKILNLNQRHQLHQTGEMAPETWGNPIKKDTPDTPPKRTVDGFIYPKPVESPKSNFAPVVNSQTPEEILNNMRRPKNNNNWIMIIFIFAIVFFVAALSYLGYKFYFGSNVLSSSNIEIGVIGPLSVAAGEELSFSVRVKNNNSVNLNTADLRVEFPEGTRTAGNLASELRRTADNLGDIKPGETGEKTMKATLFGGENEKKTISITVEYRMPGSSGIFSKQKNYDVTISSAPVSITVSGLTEVTAGQSMNFTVEVKSNSPQVISDILLKTIFPPGFNFKSSNPTPNSKNVWSLGDLEPGGIRKIRIVGVLDGQDGEERVFKFSVGLKDQKDETIIAAPFFNYNTSVLIQKPFIGVSVALNGDTSAESVMAAGQSIRADVLWQNNLPTMVSNAQILVKLRGAALNRNSVVAEGGYYRSSDDTIIFDRTTFPQLASLNPGDSGRVGFSFNVLNSAAIKSGQQTIDMEVTASATRAEGTSVPSEVLFSSAKKIKIVTSLALSSASYYYVGPFKNKGLLPPRAEQETTYTITWALTNSLNDVSGATVSASLPSYVKWLGVTSPSTETVTYNPVGGEVTWTPGLVKSGTGKSSSPRQVSFQVSLLPSLGQVGQIPTLLTETNARGIDIFTGATVTDTKDAVTTDLYSDPSFGSNQAIVTQ